MAMAVHSGYMISSTVKDHKMPTTMPSRTCLQVLLSFLCNPNETNFLKVLFVASLSTILNLYMHVRIDQTLF